MFYEIKKYSGSSGCNSGEPLCGAGTTDKERTLGGGFCEKAASSYGSKGRFIMDTAALHPDINYIGIERYSSVLLRALQKMEQNPLPNIKFICMDAADVAEVFAKDEVDRIYLNFSDPWPKDRHAKRRLTSRQFFARYDLILKKEGHLEFKTDNQDLFTFSLEEVPEAGWKLDASTRDLHHDAVLNEGNVMTEYEEKFSSKGNPICKLIASR